MRVFVEGAYRSFDALAGTSLSLKLVTALRLETNITLINALDRVSNCPDSNHKHTNFHDGNHFLAVTSDMCQPEEMNALLCCCDVFGEK